MGDKEGDDANLGQRYAARTTESRVPLEWNPAFFLSLVFGLMIF